ncbi:MAG TPA: 2-amino-4-hydroxy-6-hydroxymethyldihydropteridine diphosphokinase [Streptosporangiaceae bacterium]
MSTASGDRGRPPEDATATPVVLALGSNLGDRLANLRAGIDALTATGELTVTAVSPVYETAPVGGPDQPEYLNAVVVGRTSLPAQAVLGLAQDAEQALGRERSVRWGPRTLDVDVIAVGAQRSDDPHLTLPHPRAQERAFVLVPWLDADPGATLPGGGPVAGLAARLGRDGIRRRDDLSLTRARPRAAERDG